jgi:surfactin synthase thioesterase subunit/NAD(P)-dependent dehydrogenase (short-subunit alcohol dehydrogenase family)
LGPVDVVLNAIAAEGQAVGRALLRSGGRLIEIGLRPVAPAAAESPRNTGLFHADVLDLAAREPREIQRIYQEILRLLERSPRPDIPARVFAPADARSALKSLARAVEVGKVVVRTDSGALEALPSQCATLRPRSGTVLVTGGAGALGKTIVERLVSRGFTSVAIVSRRAASTSQTGGAAVRAFQADAGDDDQMARALEEIRATMPPIVGVIHAAGVLDDGLVENQTAERFAAVLKGKARGAQILHERIHEPLDFFVLFSSIASVVGTVGQTPYAAANAFLDGLARRRAHLGLPATSIQWGPWAGAGMAASVIGTTPGRGPAMRAMEPSACLDVMEQVVESGAVEMAVVDADWSGVAADLPLVRALMPHVAARVRARALDPDVVRAETLRLTGEVLGVSMIDAAPRDLGIDSIMSAQLARTLAASLDVNVSPAQILSASSLDAFLSLVHVEAPSPMAPATRRQPSGPDRSAWIRRIQERPGATHRLFCFPFAGVGSSIYREWATSAPVDIMAVELPGRGLLAAQPLRHRLEDLVAPLVEHLMPMLDQPFAFFGHCMGALVAYELTRALAASGRRPDHLFVSACPPPDRYAVAKFNPRTRRYVSNPACSRDGLESIHELPLDRFMEVLRFLDFGPSRQMLDDQELMHRTLPIAQADFGVCANYRYDPRPPLDIPITAFAGDEDPFFDMELPGGVRFTIDGWARQTTAPFESFERAGDHYFVLEDREFVVRTILDQLDLRLSAAS